MTDTRVSYVPGAWTLVARGRRYLLVDALPSDEPISLLWSALEAADDLAGVLDVLASAAPEAGYCLIQVDDDGIQLAQRGIAVTLDGSPVDPGTGPGAVTLPAVGGTIVAGSAPTTGSLDIPVEGGVVSAGALILAQTAGAVAHPTYTGETVLAGICLNGHYSGAHAPSCRVCGSPMPTQTPRTIGRPSLGFLVLQDGTTIDLDRGAILGRAPRMPEDSTEPPHLVNLAAYGRDVSRQHAEVIVRGWSVFVRDLGSANGTRVHDPLGQIRALETGVSVPLLPGNLIEIAEVTTIQYRTS